MNAYFQWMKVADKWCIACNKKNKLSAILSFFIKHQHKSKHTDFASERISISDLNTFFNKTIALSFW